jgi:hypothetical protein
MSSNDISPADYLSKCGVEQAIQKAIAQVLRNRPDDPIGAIGRLLLQHGEAASTDPRGLADAAAIKAFDPSTALTASKLLSSPVDFVHLTELSLKKAGITQVPSAIGACKLLKKLEISLNPAMSTLPQDMSALQSLRILFALGCSFESVPPVVAALTSLYMLSFKSNKLKTIGEDALAPSIEWLILTDNQLERLPSRLPLGLRKVMLTNNRLKSLPDSILKCKELEMIRIADNQLAALPVGMLQMPKLTWMALGGNPLTALEKDALPPPNWIGTDQLQVHEQIGAGGGGIVHRASWTTKPGEPDVALKIFRGAGTVTDGDPRHEIDLGSVLQHPNVIRVIGASPEPRLGLVLELLDVRNEWTELGGPPNFETCTRDTYKDGTEYSPASTLRTLHGVGIACAHLHAKRFTHGDLYAHNTLIKRSTGEAKVGDFGAAYHYAMLGADAYPAIERMDVRAFGCMAEELLGLLTPQGAEADALKAVLGPLVDRCLGDAQARPSFAEIVDELQKAASNSKVF